MIKISTKWFDARSESSSSVKQGRKLASKNNIYSKKLTEVESQVFA